MTAFAWSVVVVLAFYLVRDRWRRRGQLGLMQTVHTLMCAPDAALPALLKQADGDPERQEMVRIAIRARVALLEKGHTAGKPVRPEQAAFLAGLSPFMRKMALEADPGGRFADEYNRRVLMGVGPTDVKEGSPCQCGGTFQAVGGGGMLVCNECSVTVD